MKAKEIQELLDFIASSGLAEVNIETEQFKISVKKHSDIPTRMIETTAMPQMISQPAVSSSPQQAASQPTQEAPKKTEEISKDKGYLTIKSPMIGTFYRSSSPDTPAYINVGDVISSGQTVCIIEAMKLFNEIESEVSGKVVKILVENATPVEYDQPLFLIEPK